MVQFLNTVSTCHSGADNRILIQLEELSAPNNQGVMTPAAPSLPEAEWLTCSITAATTGH